MEFLIALAIAVPLVVLPVLLSRRGRVVLAGLFPAPELDRHDGWSGWHISRGKGVSLRP